MPRTSSADDPYTSAAAASGSFAGLSLWLQISNSATQEAVQHVMAELRSHVPEDAPAFEPHATLLAGLSTDEGWTPEKVWEYVQAAVRAWKASPHCAHLECSFRSMTRRDVFFQCVLIELEQQPALMALNEAMRKAFNKQEQPPYFPHISLLYAGIGGEGAEAEIAWAGEHRLWTKKGQSIEVGPANARVGVATFSKLSLWDTNGPVAQWKKLREMDVL
ncbi:2, 3 cyclic phosphodiesterase [Tilletiaria anomala UBC 951]|uniref:2, 3 cyclic phosphodiesterase n=1 Tax=Tilletiaria anomala (strain ATCC 24038 / CBS 436.72 / UBC 951) TaxID=1037660 RepID=A0A066VCQ7_TILAU|nr:2, 3 cyclic phosphodiesterase [Tilletiaria anomala UBC 951]KDN39246.1 2, 3 cyclic phosphodiesterase [Tilletiaria anomala UBC 951]